MTNDEINKLIKTFDRITDQLPAARQKQVAKLVDKIGHRFFTAPASGSDFKHDAEPGGLLSHSIKVYMNLEDLCELWFPKIPHDSQIITGLFHDLGKIGSLAGSDYYVQTTQDWQLKKGIRYEYNKSLKDGMTHAQRSSRLLIQCGVELTDEEHLAIIYHDGLYLDENEQIRKNHGYSLMNALHWADYYTAFYDLERK